MLSQVYHDIMEVFLLPKAQESLVDTTKRFHRHGHKSSMRVHCHLEVFDNSDIQNQVRSSNLNSKWDQKVPQGDKDFLTRQQGLNSFALLVYEILQRCFFSWLHCDIPKWKAILLPTLLPDFHHFFWCSTYHPALARTPMSIGSSWGSKAQLGTRIQTLIEPSY